MTWSINRRQACGIIAASAWNWGRTILGDSAETSSQLNYCLASSLYGELPLAEILPQVKAVGAKTIDLWPRVHGNQREQVDEMGEEKFQRLLEEHGVRLGMTTRYDLGPYRLKDEIEFVSRFGGRMIVTGCHSKEGATLRDQVRAFVESLKQTVELAEERGVTIAIENHGNSLINTPDSLRYFAEFASSPNLGIAFAPYHLPQQTDVLSGLIRDLGPNLVHFYAWEHGDGCMTKLPKEQELKQLPGFGSLDFGPLLSALKKINYSGWTEIFMHPVPRGIPILPTAQEVTETINRSRDYLNRKWSQLK